MDPSTQNAACTTSSHHDETPLCARNCGFYGSPENRGLCSKCFKDYLRESGADLATTAVEALKTSPPKIEALQEKEAAAAAPTSSAAPPARIRCGTCNKKVGLLGFVCKCEGSFCSTHRYPEAHACRFDFKKAGKALIEKENPVCKADKISDRI